MGVKIIGVWLPILLVSVHLNIIAATEEGKDGRKDGIPTATVEDQQFTTAEEGEDDTKEGEISHVMVERDAKKDEIPTTLVENQTASEQINASISSPAPTAESSPEQTEATNTAPNEVENRTSINRNDATSVWIVENGNVIKIEVPNYSEFDSNKVYIIIHQINSESRDPSAQKMIFYWVGQRSSEGDAVFAATYAVSNCENNFSTVVRREAIGLESDSFKAIFKIDGNTSSLPGEIIEEKATRMILIEKTRTIASDMFETREVEFSKKYIHEDKATSNCCIAFNSSKVYTYCGWYAVDLLKVAARKLSTILLKKVVPRAQEFLLIVTNSQKDIYKLEQLGHDFDRIDRRVKDHIKATTASTSPKAEKKGPKFSPTKILGGFGRKTGKSGKVDPKEQEKQAENSDNNIPTILVLQIYDDKNEKSVNELQNKPEEPLIFPFRSEDCYLVDSGVARLGILVWLGKKSSLNEGRACARRAELLSREKKDGNSGPVIMIFEKGSDLAEFPKIFGNVKKLIGLMENLHISWEDILLPFDEDKTLLTSGVGSSAFVNYK